MGTHPTGPREPRLRIWPFGLRLVPDLLEIPAQPPGVPGKKGHSTTSTISPSHTDTAGQTDTGWKSVMAELSAVICS